MSDPDMFSLEDEVGLDGEEPSMVEAPQLSLGARVSSLLEVWLSKAVLTKVAGHFSSEFSRIAGQMAGGGRVIEVDSMEMTPGPGDGCLKMEFYCNYGPKEGPLNGRCTYAFKVHTADGRVEYGGISY